MKGQKYVTKTPPVCVGLVCSPSFFRDGSSMTDKKVRRNLSSQREEPVVSPLHLRRGSHLAVRVQVSKKTWVSLGTGGPRSPFVMSIRL